MREFTAVSLFCGAGGLDMGFDHADLKRCGRMTLTRMLVKPIVHGVEQQLYVEILLLWILRWFRIVILCSAGFHAKGFHYRFQGKLMIKETSYIINMYVF